MKNLSTAMTEIVKGNSARYYSKYVVDGKEHTETLNNFKFQNMINPNNEITIGNTCSSSVTFSIYMPTVSLENKEITIFEGVKVGTEIKYIQLGIFTVTKQTSDGEYTSYEAYDRMYKGDMPYFSDMAFPNTDKAILNEICGKLGISLATNIATTHTISDKPQGYTYREIIGYMAMLQGCNAVINSDGNLEIKWYKDSGYILDGHKYYQQGVTFTTSKDFIIQKLTCNNTKSDSTEQSEITSGDGATGLSFANPFMTQAILDEVYKKIGGFTFRPLTVKFVGDYRLEVGDIITVNKGGVDYKVPIMQIMHECDGGLMDTVASIGQSDTENTNVASGPITKQMERYYANLLVVNKALINKLDVDTAKITYATITNLTAVKGDVDYLKVNNLTVDKANLLYASIERMEVVEGQIRNLNVDDLKAQVANINTLMFGSATGGSLTTEFSNSIVANIGDAQIKSAMIESIAADKITSGKIYTNLVEILSESGNLDITDNTIQIKDDKKVTRVQIGKDANSDYNMYVWDKNGNLMFDALGLTESGIQREIIRNDMVSQDANISAKKLDINSLFDVINNDGSHTLKSSKIYVDSDNQTLDVAFKQVTTNVESVLSDIGTIKKSINTVIDTISTQGTQITAIQGQISSKVWQQDITTAVADLQIGGRNLFQGTKKFVFQNVIALDGVGSGIATEKYKGLTVRVKTTPWNFYRPTLTLEAGRYVFSSYVKGKSKYKGDIRVTNVTENTTLNANAFDINSEWERQSLTFELAKKANVKFSLESTGSGEIYECGWKLEEGNKATDWTPAPEDIDSSISTVEGKVTTVSNQYTSLNQSLTSLTATVNSNTTKISKKADGSTVTALQANVTALTADLSGFKTSVSNTYATKTSLSDYATVTAMNSAITQSASSILTTVSSNYATKASLEVKIDKDKLISEINASADIITLKSNRFVLDSANAKIAADGTVNFTGGTIGGWSISSTKLSGSAGLQSISINKPSSTSTKVISIDHIDTTAAATYVDDFYVTADGKLNAYNKVIVDGSGKDVGSYILMETWGNSGDKFQTKTTGLEYYTLDLTNRNYIKIQPEGIYFGNENESTHRGAVFLGSTNNIVSTFHQYQVQNENGVIKGWLSDKVFTMQDGWNNDAIYADWNGNFKCTGTKNRIVQTENFGTVAMNAFETAGAYFADVCSGKIASDGKCVVYLNRKFIETIDCDCEYQILITAVNKKSNLYVVKEREFFTVFGEPETYFDCMIIARQKGYVTTYADEEKNLNINREEVSVYGNS
jgi:hypothetical protein|nr:MAG TPA: Minor structural protein [Bacteriophage sp.]